MPDRENPFSWCKTHDKPFQIIPINGGWVWACPECGATTAVFGSVDSLKDEGGKKD